MHERYQTRFPKPAGAMLMVTGVAKLLSAFGAAQNNPANLWHTAMRSNPLRWIETPHGAGGNGFTCRSVPPRIRLAPFLTLERLKP